MNKVISRIISLSLNLCLFLLLSTRVPAAPAIYTDDNTLKSILNNGMNVVIHETHKATIATIVIIVKTGSATEGRFSGSGVSHLVEHMLFKSNGEKDTRSCNERIKLLGGRINGFASHDYTGYTVTVPGECVVEALKILKDIIASPAFDGLELKKEKEVILEEIRRNRDNPARFALDSSWTLTFQEHPYKYPIIGHEDLFEQIEKKDLEEYYSARYSPHAMILVVSGDVKKDRLFEKVEDIFGPLKRSFIPSFSNIREPLQFTRRHRIEYRAVSLAHVALSYRSASINDTALYPLDILAIALGTGEDSILAKELRDKKRLLHYITCQNYTLRDSGLFYIYFTAEHSKVNDAIAAILEELESVKKNGTTDAILKKSKRIAKAGLANALETTEGRARDISISEAIANDYKFSQLYLNKLLNVTADDVKSAANAYLKRGFLNTVHILPEEKEETAIQPGAIQQVERKILKETMPNGMRILVCEDRSTPTCSISALFLGGVRAEHNTNNGISCLVSKLLLDGTKDKNEEQIKSAIESVGGSIMTISGKNSSGIMLNFLSDDWKRGIEVISDAVINSAFNDEKIEKEKILALAAIKERDDDIVRSGFLLFKQNFFGEHPYRFDPLGTEENIQNIKKDDIVGHYESLCVPGNMVLTITGDIEADEVISEIKKQFASFKRMEPKLPKPAISKRPKEKKEISNSMKREQSLIIVGFPSVKLTDRDRYIFEVIDSIMSGSNGRMFNNIRDKLGMTYALGSSFQPGLEPGCHIFYALTSRQNIEAIKDAILKEIKGLKDKTIPEEELEAAKRCLITSFMTALQRNETLGLTMSLDELYGLGYNNFETYNAEINNVTAGQIKRVASQYFTMKNCLIVVIRGEDENRS